MMKHIALIAAFLVCYGCAVQKDWVATGGSRADGTVKLSYEHGIYEKPVLDESQGLSTAQSRCSAWGYSRTEAFGGSMSECNSTDGLGSCNRWLVTKEYQCID